jgi:polysaccharide biosynthesis/export protein
VKNKFIQPILYGLILLLLNSCIPFGQMRYMYRDGESSKTEFTTDTVSAYKLMQNDLLSIDIATSIGGTTEIISKTLDDGSQKNEIGTYAKGYIIDSDGNIDIPYVQKIKIEGLTIKQAEELVYSKLSEYLNHITVKLRIMSFRITFIGEFRRIGIQVIYSPQVNILQAISLGGELTEFANRKKLTIYRKDLNSKIKKIEFDLTRKNIYDKSYFYIMPGDILYAEPLKIKLVKINSSYYAFAVSILSFSLLMINYLKK